MRIKREKKSKSSGSSSKNITHISAPVGAGLLAGGSWSQDIHLQPLLWPPDRLQGKQGTHFCRLKITIKTSKHLLEKILTRGITSAFEVLRCK
jgi:hypothetical protein